MAMKNVVVYGGSGALGREVVKRFTAEKWNVVNVDLVWSGTAEKEVVVMNGAWKDMESDVLSGVARALGGAKLDAVVNVAGGWAGGNIASSEMVDSAELMWKQSVCSSVIAGQIAAQHMGSKGLLVLPGAAAAAEGGTSFMIGYGMAKAAVHHLIQSLAQSDSGLVPNTTVVGVLPTTIDTPMNRSGMPDADFTSWTPCDAIADTIFNWTSETPSNGGLYKFDTAANVTKVTMI
eukprot:TRINITY_DN3313_c0_g1_i1.p1 TRINITY_DN3313_c0_g1~~TRINITY_DN3313_c0_g1_i1.p1  ORF type:complete len:251 (+),score=80.26 TRINITY_DN3313_c0_g1_i1:53-754(+)